MSLFETLGYYIRLLRSSLYQRPQQFLLSESDAAKGLNAVVTGGKLLTILCRKEVNYVKTAHIGKALQATLALVWRPCDSSHCLDATSFWPVEIPVKERQL